MRGKGGGGKGKGNVLPRIRLSPLTLCSFALFLFPLFRILSILVSFSVVSI